MGTEERPREPILLRSTLPSTLRSDPSSPRVTTRSRSLTTSTRSSFFQSSRPSTTTERRPTSSSSSPRLEKVALISTVDRTSRPSTEKTEKEPSNTRDTPQDTPAQLTDTEQQSTTKLICDEACFVYLCAIVLVIVS